MAHWKTILLHALGWALVLAFVLPDLAQIYHTKGWMGIGRQAVHTVTVMAAFYYCYLLAWPLFSRPGKRWLCALLVLLAPLVYWIAWYTLISLLYLIAGVPDDMGGFEQAIKKAPYNPIPVIILSGVVWGLKEVRRRSRENKLLRQEKEQVEMGYIRMQFNPHFLFNMLTNLYYSAVGVSEELAEQVKKIADLMEYGIRIQKDELVNVDTEIEQIRNYTDIFRMRFGPKFHVAMEVAGSTEDMRIPPLLLLPFVENAYKHGVVSDPERPVTIQINTGGKGLNFCVKNVVARHNYKDPTKGIGLHSIRRRLQLIYPGRHSLKIDQSNNMFSAYLHINL